MKLNVLITFLLLFQYLATSSQTTAPENIHFEEIVDIVHIYPHHLNTLYPAQGTPRNSLG